MARLALDFLYNGNPCAHIYRVFERR
ncbi:MULTISPECIES: SWIM zinc finger family protein [unclassified Microcystis]